MRKSGIRVVNILIFGFWTVDRAFRNARKFDETIPGPFPPTTRTSSCVCTLLKITGETTPLIKDSKFFLLYNESWYIKFPIILIDTGRVLFRPLQYSLTKRIYFFFPRMHEINFFEAFAKVSFLITLRNDKLFVA